MFPVLSYSLRHRAMQKCHLKGVYQGGALIWIWVRSLEFNRGRREEGQAWAYSHFCERILEEYCV